MEVSTLLFCTDPDALDVLRRALAKVGISAEVCTGISAGMKLLGRRKFEGILVDCDDLDGGVELLKSLRSLPTAKSTIIFALINRSTSIGDGFKLGANFVLEKPLSFDRVLRCFRASHGLMIGERRRYFRYNLEIPVHLTFGGKGDISASSVEVSLGGMSFITQAQLEPDKEGALRFTVPESNHPFAALCRVVWSNHERTGIQFLKVPKDSRQALEQWLAELFHFEQAHGKSGRRSSNRQ